MVLGKARDRSALTCGLSLSKAALSTDLSPPVENYSIVICYRFTLSSRTCCQSYRDLEVPQRVPSYIRVNGKCQEGDVIVSMALIMRFRD